jgi:ATP-dependent Clp protease adaptor protein ClpS
MTKGFQDLVCHLERRERSMPGARGPGKSVKIVLERLKVLQMPEWDDDDEFDSDQDTGVATETKKKVKKPPLYKVLLHNDDYTTMEFVVYVLKTVFHKSETDSVTIMMAVHNQGVGVAGVFSYEIAEAKVTSVTELAQANDFPLLCTIEED